MNKNASWVSALTFLLLIAGTCGRIFADTNTTQDVRDPKDVIQEIVREAGKNPIPNEGPMPGGKISPRFEKCESAIREWMSINGESIVGACGGPLEPGDNYATTRKDNKIYVHVLNWDGKNYMEIPMVTDRELKKTWLLKEPPNASDYSWGLVRNEGIGLRVVVPVEYQDDTDTIVVIEFEDASIEKASTQQTTSEQKKEAVWNM